MSIVTTRAGTVIDALVSKLRASAAFADPVRVFDGPVTADDTMWTQAAFVGFDGNWGTDSRGSVAPNTHYESWLSNQESPYIGGPTFGTSVKETLEIFCCVEVWAGDPNVQSVRNQALVLQAAADTVIRTDPTLGIDGSTIAHVATTNGGSVFDSDNQIGFRIPFVVHVTTYILST